MCACVCVRPGALIARWCVGIDMSAHKRALLRRAVARRLTCQTDHSAHLRATRSSPHVIVHSGGAPTHAEDKAWIISYIVVLHAVLLLLNTVCGVCVSWLAQGWPHFVACNKKWHVCSIATANIQHIMVPQQILPLPMHHGLYHRFCCCQDIMVLRQTIQLLCSLAGLEVADYTVPPPHRAQDRQLL